MFWNSTQECIFRLVTFLSALGWEKIGKLMFISKSLTTEKNFSGVPQSIPGILPLARTPRNSTVSHNGCKGKTCGLKLMHLTQLLFHSAMVTPMVAFRAWPCMHVSLYLCISVCLYLCIHIHIHIHVHIHIHIYIHIHVYYLYVNTNMNIMHVHMCTFMQTHSTGTWTCTDIYLLTCN